MKNWKTKPIRARRNSVRSRSLSRSMRRPPTQISPAVGPVDARDEVQQSRLAGAAATHQGYEFTRGDLAVDVGQDDMFGTGLRVTLTEPVDADHRSIGLIAGLPAAAQPSQTGTACQDALEESVLGAALESNAPRRPVR